jgi:hypothetical protein
MRAPSVLLVAISVIFLAAPAQAQDVGPGAIISPKADLPLRNAPPGGLIGLKGDTIGQASPANSFRVIDKKTISTVLGGENWLKLQRVDDASKQGWVFSGTKADPVANIHVKSH